MKFNVKPLSLFSSVFAITMSTTNPTAACGWCDDCGDNKSEINSHTQHTNTPSSTENVPLLESNQSPHLMQQELKEKQEAEEREKLKREKQQRELEEQQKQKEQTAATQPQENLFTTLNDEDKAKEQTPTSIPVVSSTETMTSYQENLLTVCQKDKVSPVIWKHLEGSNSKLAEALVNAIKGLSPDLRKPEKGIIDISFMSSNNFKLKVGIETPSRTYYKY